MKRVVYERSAAVVVRHACEEQECGRAGPGRCLGELRGGDADAARVSIPVGAGVLGAIEVEEG